MEDEVEAIRRRLQANLNDPEIGRALCKVQLDTGGETKPDEDRICEFMFEHYGLSVDPGVWGPWPADQTAAKDALRGRVRSFALPWPASSPYFRWGRALRDRDQAIGRLGRLRHEWYHRAVTFPLMGR